MRKLFFALLLTIGYTSCKKPLCVMYRYDLSYVYRIEKQDTSFYFYIWEEPKPTDTNFKQEILDSMARLRSLGYSVNGEAGFRYKSVECNSCDELNKKKPSAKATCGVIE